MSETLVIVMDEDSVDKMVELKAAVADGDWRVKLVVYAGDRMWEEMLQADLGVSPEAWTTIAASSDSLRPLWWWAWSLIAQWNDATVADSCLMVWDGRWSKWRLRDVSAPHVVQAWWAVRNARTPWETVDAMEDWCLALAASPSPDAAKDIIGQLSKWIELYIIYSDAVHGRPNSYDWGHGSGRTNSARQHCGLDLGTKRSALAKQSGSLRQLSGAEFPVPWGSVERLAEPCDSRHRATWPQRLRHWSALLFVRAEFMAKSELRVESVLMAQRSLETYLYALALENGIVQRDGHGEWRWGGAVNNAGLPSFGAIYSHLANMFAPLSQAEDDVDELRWLRNSSVCGHGWGGADAPAASKALTLVHDVLVAVDSAGLWRAAVVDFKLGEPSAIATVFGVALKVSLSPPGEADQVRPR